MWVGGRAVCGEPEEMLTPRQGQSRQRNGAKESWLASEHHRCLQLPAEGSQAGLGQQLLKLPLHLLASGKRIR